MSMSFASASRALADYRTKGVRNSQDVLEKGLFILQGNGLKKLGDEAPVFLEQLALAALDLGNLDVADKCITDLVSQFPGSPRVECLQGMRIEATGRLKEALLFYKDILKDDESNAIIWKRQISVLRQLSQLEDAVKELNTYLDTFYADAEGWLELADIYASLNLYPQSLAALSHALLISPQNPFYVLQYAETAYTADDVPLALKMFLRVAEMVGKEEPREGRRVVGVAHRAWYGVKLCIRRFAQNKNLPSASETTPPQHPLLLDELATERLLDAYSSSGDKPGAAAESRSAVLRWLEVK
ncbi:hypothetical protein BOTBODRAFT_36926 [Botryobasidium botryosum FD-172 SS1]|uniref:ER membrane protein complex subunit 2 n=1 Tax=Botryobasidium botryosum (strain FD-172 SS1) TaxID=930990 RepID=A0A067M1T3_BOTB1|nr:hypothetical protein BOTBODRAFT_36926 [Botryobasidium botryosum FD-172 SS1]